MLLQVVTVAAMVPPKVVPVQYRVEGGQGADEIAELLPIHLLY